METHREEKALTGWHSIAAGLVLAALLGGPVALVATVAKSPAQDGSAEASALAEPQDAGPSIPHFVLPDTGDIGRFAFGHVDFDWDPTDPSGVPGVDYWPPRSSRRK